ncbi:MAG: LysM peptidoglycan-binding domain-containing protein [Bacteroidia bacterium]
MSILPFVDAQTRKLAKLTIIAFPEKDSKANANFDLLKGFTSNPLSALSSIKSSASGIFEAMYNPVQFSRKSGMHQVPKSDTGGGSAPPPVETKFSHNDKLNFDLILDATGASPSASFYGTSIASTIAASPLGIDTLIKHFIDICYKDNNGTHTQNSLWLIWGTNFFAGKLESVNTTYNLFDRIGRPIRATMSVSFIEHDKLTFEKLKKIKQSPDVSKTRTVKAGDTLLLLAKEMYDDESLYLEVARINNLKNYRRLTPGQVLVFPPINQKED